MSEALRDGDSELERQKAETAAAIYAACVAFERRTGRVLESIELQRIEITPIASLGREFALGVGMTLAPTPGA